MSIKNDYLKAAVNTILRMDPSLDEKDVTEIVESRMKQTFTNPTVVMENDIKKKREVINLTKLCDWLDREKPVISGNATFYVQPDVLRSPTVVMLRDLKKSRSRIKKEMFTALAQGDMDTYNRLDLTQANAKIKMNAEYGASGAPSAAFYNKYTPSATTLMAQSIITILAAFFEGFLGDNQKFFHINECMDWLNCVISSKKGMDKWISVPSKKEVILRVKKLFYLYDVSYDDIIEDYISNLSEEEMVFVFYTNNLKALFKRNDKVTSLIKDILVTLPILEASLTVPNDYADKYTTEEYNQMVSKEMFMNPYSPPITIEKEMNELSDIVIKYCYVDYLTPDSIEKLNNHKRTAVLLVDTDSNVINSNLFVEFILDELLANESFGRKRIYNEIICINVLAKILDSAIVKVLDLYGRKHNMNEEARKELSMKNEFMFRRLLLMEEKKRYASSIVLREGNILIPFKTDIKGLDFIKAGVTDEVTDTFTKILENRILFSEELELREMMKDLRAFEEEIRNDLIKGGVRFLKPQSYKPEGAYKVNSDGTSNAWALPTFRAVTVWNELYPNNKIHSLDRVKLIKLVVIKNEDLDIIKDTFPEEHALVTDKIFRSSSYDIIKAGLKVIAIPNTVKQVPDWIIPLIDYKTIISDVMGSFRSILKALKIQGLDVKTPSGSAKLVSGLISL